MDWLSFLSSVIGSLAWPASLLLLVLVLRKPIRELLPGLQRLRYKELELEFERRIEEIREEVAEELPANARLALPAPESDAILRLAEVSPRAAVLEAWRILELAALAAARRLGGDALRGATITFHAIRFLERAPTVDRSAVSLLRDLRGLRNQAAHAPEFALTRASALGYAATAATIARYLKGIAEGA